MNEFKSEPEGTLRRPLAAHIVLVGVLLVSFAVLLSVPMSSVIRGVNTVQSETVQAMAIVGVVLAEAVALYVGYGALVAIVKPLIHGLLSGDSAWNSSD